MVEYSENKASDSASVTRKWIEYYEELSSKKGFHGSERSLNSFQSAQLQAVIRSVSAMLSKKDIIHIWSAGSGVDIASARIKKLFGNRTRITLGDVSPICIALNKNLFDSLKLEAEFLVEDLLESQHMDEFDIVTNTGLLEHFNTIEKQMLVEKFHKSLKKGGKYIALVPCSRARIYTRCMERMKSKGIWPYGPEEPIDTFRPLSNSRFRLNQEYEVDCADQFGLMPIAYPVLGKIFVPINVLSSRLAGPLDKILVRAFGGYCLLGEFEKSDDAALLQN
jgi:2-polyprenyl-3-methyl-5-hydroxy-6-metoxy-1,4-benzoquinol methylase